MTKLLITGSSSFLGQHVTPLLTNQELLTPRSSELNLLNSSEVLSYIKENKPDTILHMAALCGGIGANKDRPGDFILENTKMAINLFDAIKETNTVSYFYGLGSVCMYPKYCPVPFKEEDIWNGYPEETNAPYGIAKRHLLVMQDAFRKQYGLKGAHLVPVNLFGIQDHFDLKNSHVIPALINKFVNAKRNNLKTVEVWGDGSPTREFLFVKDCAKAIVKAVIEKLDYSEPINIGTGKDISIKDLASLIGELVDFDGEIKFTGEVSVNGQPKRKLNVSRMKEVLGMEAETELRDGLKETIDWYIANGNN